MEQYLMDVIHGMRIAWASPEFVKVKWGIACFVLGAVLGYVARWDGERAARLDEMEEQSND